MKVLFLGAGRRVSLAKRFKSHGFEVFSYETENNVPISQEATVIKGFRWADEKVEQNIINTIIKYDINLVIPLQDAATKILAQIKKNNPELAPLFPIPDSFASNMCLNKRKLQDYFYFNSFYPAPNPNFDVIIKPIEGANSKGIKVISFEEFLSLKENKEFVETYVAQKFVKGDEYSIDAYFNKDCKLVDCVPRKRLEIQGGEVNRSITVDPNLFALRDLTKKIGERIGLRGPVCFQFIVNNLNIPYLMEINARFGGGVILSLEAGLDIIEYIKQEYIKNLKIEPVPEPTWKINFGMTRYFEEYFYDI